tara:strand:- start:365 stop:1213 length:849 start_codon:yes stop_codon:yes gene_type:complete
MNILIRVLLIQILALFILIGCAEGESSNNDTEDEIAPITTGNWYRPPILATWQWQLSGEVNNSYSVNMYDIDLFDSSKVLIQQIQSANMKVICYFSAGSYEDWRTDASDFTSADLGNPLDGWPGESWLDIRSANVSSIMKKRLDLAVQKGCDGVEPDNMDGYTQNSGFNLTPENQLKYNRMIANEAHQRNLSVGLKNDLDQISELVDYYDFALNEQCFKYSECELLIPFINNGKPVFNAEYDQEYIESENAREKICTDSLNMAFSTLILPISLDDEFRLSCL